MRTTRFGVILVLTMLAGRAAAAQQLASPLDASRWTVLLASPDPYLPPRNDATSAGPAQPHLATALTVQAAPDAAALAPQSVRTGWDLRHTAADTWLDGWGQPTLRLECGDGRRLIARLLQIEQVLGRLPWLFRPMARIALQWHDQQSVGAWPEDRAEPAWAWPPPMHPELATAWGMADRPTQRARLVGWEPGRGALATECVTTDNCIGGRGVVECHSWWLDLGTGAAQPAVFDPAAVLATELVAQASPEGGSVEDDSAPQPHAQDTWTWIRTVWGADGHPVREGQVALLTAPANSGSVWSWGYRTVRYRTPAWPRGDAPPPSLPAPLAAAIAADYPQHVIVGVIPPR